MNTNEMGATEELDFSLDRDERPVKIGGEDYVVLELDGRERDIYLNNVSARMRVDKDGKPSGVKNFTGLQSSLLALATRKIVDGEKKPVPEKEIQAWPSKVQSKLFDIAKELSDLGDEKKDEGDPGNE